MRSPLDEGSWLVLDEVASTQDVAADLLLDPRSDPPGIVFAHDQKNGRGRFQREWQSELDLSLTMSLVYRSYADHRSPWFIGMAVALAVAATIEGKVRWPNDVMLNGKKIGGVLTELIVSNRFGNVPVIGVGVNLNQAVFPSELENSATSLFLETSRIYNPKETAEAIIEKISDLPEPEDWNCLQHLWEQYDETPGKHYRLPSGERATAIKVGSLGELVCEVNGETRSVMAAEAILADP